MLLLDDSNPMPDHLSNTQSVPQTTTAAFNHYQAQQNTHQELTRLQYGNMTAQQPHSFTPSHQTTVQYQ